MSVAGDAIEEGGQSDEGGSEPAEPTQIEGDVPKPAFEEPPEKEPEQAARPNGKEKRNQKAGGYAAEVARWRQEAQQERQERQRMGESLARLEGEMRARAQPAADPVREQLRYTRKQIEQSLERMGKGDTSALEEWHNWREQEQRIISRAEAEAVAQQYRPPQVDPVLTSIVGKHEWLQTDIGLRQVAEANVERLVRLEGRDMSNPVVRKQTLLQAAAEVEREFKLGGNTSEPSDVQKERYRGTSGQSSGAGRSDSRGMVYLTADQKAQAESLFRHLDSEAAHKEWWSKIGKRILDGKK